MSIKLIAIDPGQSGGIATLDVFNKVQAHKMPDTVQGIQDFFKALDKDLDVIQCYIEQLHAGSVAQGPRKSAKTIWSQASNYSALICGLYNSYIPVNEISPVKWMSLIKGHGQRPKDYPERKKWLKSYAVKRFPALKVTNYTADALALLDAVRKS